MQVRDALTIVGGLSKPSKMPAHGYSIPARACATGSKLREQSGTVCGGCYALKGRYVFPNVAAALERRLESLHDPRWIEAMSTMRCIPSMACLFWMSSPIPPET